jgi:hypothetical protein
MEALRCPICDKQGLQEVFKETTNKRFIVCINENFTHSRLGNTHFIYRKEPVTKDMPQLILN